MTKKVILISFLFSVLAGCSVIGSEHKLYEVRMMSGDRLYAKSKPKVDEDGYYRFKDVNDQTYIIRENLILFIEPSTFQK